jgi:energy-coupling factor transporter ATP-binding protein EcfA2
MGLDVNRFGYISNYKSRSLAQTILGVSIAGSIICFGVGAAKADKNSPKIFWGVGASICNILSWGCYKHLRHLRPFLGMEDEARQFGFSEALSEFYAPIGNAERAANLGNAVLEPSQPLQQECVATAMAELLLETNENRSVIVIAPSGCGKTNLLNSAMWIAHEKVFRGDIDLFIASGKLESKGYLGLERNQNDCVICESSDDVPGFLSLYYGAIGKMDGITQSPYPVLVVVDEYNNTLASVQSAERAKIVDKYSLDVLKDKTLKLLTKGRSKNFTGWVTTHSADVQTIGIPKQQQANFAVVILGRKKKQKDQLIRDALGAGNNPIVSGGKLREELTAQLDNHIATCGADSFFALTNIRGHWELVTLPQYPDTFPPINRKAFNQTTGEIFDNQLDNSSEVQQLNQMFNSPAAVRLPNLPKQQTNKLPDPAIDLLKYVRDARFKHADSEGYFQVETLRANWGKKRNLGTSQLRELLREINTAGWGQFGESDFRTWKPNIPPDALLER